MRRTDAERLLGALLGNGTGVRATRRRKSAPRSLAGSAGGNALARTAISVLGGIAIEVIRGMNQPAQATQASPAQPKPVPPRRMPSIDARGTPWSAPPLSAPPAAPGPESDAEAEEALLLVRAMIAAARADGAIDAGERRAIAERIDAAGLDAAQRDQVLAEFGRPASIEVLAGQVPDPVAAAQLYAASVIAMGEISPAERTWLDQLASALRLSPQAARSIEERLSA